jgi:hypothetical protein
MANPTASDLLVRGLFHDRIIPPISSLNLEQVIQPVLELARQEMNRSANARRRSRLVRHSVPKMKHLRRHFGVPNPYSQAMLCIAVAENWERLDVLCKKSPISLSRPVISSRRAVASEHSRRVEGVRRAQASVGRRFMLKADISAFYQASTPTVFRGQSTEKKLRGRDEQRTGTAINSIHGSARRRTDKPAAFR